MRMMVSIFDIDIDIQSEPYLDKLFKSVDIFTQFPSNEFIENFLAKNTQGVFSEQHSILSILEHMTTNAKNYCNFKVTNLDCSQLDENGKNIIPCIDTNDLHRIFSAELIGFIYLERLNVKYDGQIDKLFLIYRMFTIVLYRELSVILFATGHFEKSLKMQCLVNRQYEALQIWLTGEYGIDFINTEKLLTEINAKKARKRWGDKVEQQRQRYLQHYKEKGFTTYKACAMWIWENDNPENLDFDTIRNHLSKADKEQAKQKQNKIEKK